MRKLRERQDSQYLSNDGVQLTKKVRRVSRKTPALISILCSLLAAMFLLTAVTSGLSPTSFTAFADEDQKSKDKLGDLAKDYIPDEKEGVEGGALWETMQKGNKSNRDADDFGSVISRLFSTDYLNDTEKAVAQGGKQNGINGSKKNCAVNAPGAGTLTYHNCDVPNILTEIMQDVVSFVSETGPQNAEIQKATLMWSNFGLPSSIPGKGAPVKASERSVKYTGLELYGYNLRMTSYAGEWDHIKVMTAARTMANFGWMDNLKLSVKTIFEGVKGGINKSAENFADNISTGNVMGAIGGLFSGLFEGSVSSSVHTILDTSDLNVFNTYAWYRVGFGGTLYNARELTGSEIAARAQTQMLNMITNSIPDQGQVPDELVNIAAGPPDPKEAIAKCVLQRGNLPDIERGKTGTPPGMTDAECAAKAQTEYEIRQAAEEPPENDNAKYTWTVDGNQKLETLKEWKSNNASLFSVSEKYGMSCEVDENENLRENTLASFKACWPDAHAEAADKSLKDEEMKESKDWVDANIKPEAFQKWINADPSRNFNAPWNRFVCTDKNGKDIKEGSALVMLYDSNGNKNSSCGNVRPPIQDAMFGNGYVDGQEKPLTDTRRASLDTSVMSYLVPMDAIATAVANVGLQSSAFLTRVSNSVINLTFSPVFETLGIDKIVIELIKAFRDSVFFPLVSLMVAIMGIMALWSAGKNKDYKKQFISILLMAGIIMTGVFLMFKPEMTLKMVDEVPSQIEKAIIGSIFSVGNGPDDELCSATGTASSGTGTGLDGSKLKFSPNDSTRSLMCENWRAFVFSPWTQGQWGTDMSNLYSNGSGAEVTMKNSKANQDLVGNAGVNMGGGKTVKNWAIYQLDTMSSGTASFADPSRPSGYVDSNFYRLVDMQAGPKMGAGADGTYFESWTGSDWSLRTAIGIMSPVVALFGSITIVVYAITKVIISLTTVVMLLFLPLIFLVGIHPTMGRMKLKAYVGTIVGLMLQRVVLVMMMAVMLRVVIGFTTSSGNYFLNSIAAIIACIAFLMMRKQVLDLVFSSISSKMGAPIGGQYVSDPTKWHKEKIMKPNGFIANKSAIAFKGAESIAAGSIAGFVTGGRAGMVKSAKETYGIERTNLVNMQRRKGYKGLQTVTEAANAGKREAQSEIYGTREGKQKQAEVLKDSKPYQDYEIEKSKYEDFDADEHIERGTKYKVNDKGQRFDKPIAPKLATRDNFATSRKIKQMIDLEAQMANKRNKTGDEFYGDENKKSQYGERSKAINEADAKTQDSVARDIVRDNRFKQQNETNDEEKEVGHENLVANNSEYEYLENERIKAKGNVQHRENRAEKIRSMKESLVAKISKAEKSRIANKIEIDKEIEQTRRDRQQGGN